MANQEKSCGVFCLTGKMAAGKNFISSQLEKEGALSIDLDETVHQAVSLNKDTIIKTFTKEAEKRGISLLNQDGSLNRRALGEIVFSDSDLLHKQECIVYPKVIEIVDSFINSNPGKKIILNATVLYKTPELMKKCSKILFVTAPFFKRLIRAKKRDKLPLLQILARFKTQKTLLKEYKKAGKEFSIPIEIIRN